MWPIAFAKYRAIYEGHGNAVSGQRARAFHEGLRRLIDALVTGLIEGTAGRAPDAGVADADEVRAFSPLAAVYRGDSRRPAAPSRQVPVCGVYASAALARSGSGPRHDRRALRFFLAHSDRLPPPYCQQALDEPAHRVVCGLHRRHDRRFLPPHLRADHRAERLLGHAAGGDF